MSAHCYCARRGDAYVLKLRDSSGLIVFAVSVIFAVSVSTALVFLRETILLWAMFNVYETYHGVFVLKPF